MHDVDWLWQFHRTHHLTKHPNPLLSLYADTEQEIMDIAGIPFLTWLSIRALGLPMGYYDWWVCNQFIVFVEMYGHSGLRIQASPPSTVTPLLRLAGCELVIEDHDLHHRKGWKKSVNYGKQTRLWDRLFGTLGQRVENVEGNLDYDHPVTMPIFGTPKAPEGWIVPPPGSHGEVKGGPVNGHAGTNGSTRDTNGVARRQKEAEAANHEKTRLK
jgi:sterol desaturase/sphingolipid hydroxylase (fatty acid hydroxylase superfamily)